jgi:hypothetical protein
MIGSTPQPASALPGNPAAFGSKSSYKLFSRLISYINVNRVYMGVNTLGEIAVDSAGRGTTQGGFWPRGTPDNYVFNSGMQVAGVVAGVKSTANPWGGDTTGGWFFDGQGGRTETESVTPAYQAFNSADAANWPAQAFVPQGDAVANIYAPPLQGLISASQGDVEFLSWDGNPKLNTGRLHPLGVMVDYRLLAWNFPAGAQDVVFVIATVYNITSSNCPDYAAQRPAIAAIACAQGAKFQALNNAQYGIQLPAGGYTITNAYTALAADNDVGTVNANYNGVILPFAMGYTYDGPFSNAISGWKFDPSIFGTPFFAGSGFIGLKYLKGPDGPGAIQLMSTFCNGAAVCGTGHSDPPNMGADYRLMAGQPYPTDGQCNITSPGLTAGQIHVCFMLLGAVGADTRMIESSTNTSLAPGQAKSIVIGYVYAAPVAIPGFTANGTNVPPGDVTRTNSTDSMYKYNQSGSPGANKIDSISGFLSYNGPHFNADGSVHLPIQTEFSVVKNSLLGKALVAQAVFDAHFLQEFAPDAPQFFLIPGNKQVTILWKPSDTETIGDPFFSVVSSPQSTVGGLVVNNPLYDPNYRQFDVEGYRIYRGRSDSPSALILLIQFDYAGTKIKDYTGFVELANPTGCAPELGIVVGCPATTPAGGFPTPANPTPPGTAATRFVAYNIGPNTDAAGNVYPLMFVDQTAGTRLALNGNTTAIATVVDTVVSGSQDAINGVDNPPLADTGVPFIFTDVAGAPGCAKCGVNNGVNYYYSVTAFDVNAPGHGPTSLESARVTKQVVPQAPASNFTSTGTLSILGPNGRSGALTDTILPTIDPAKGTFSKKFPPTNALNVALQAFVTTVLNSGTVTVRLDSVVLNASGGGTGTELATNWFSDISGTKTTVFSLPVQINDAANGDVTSSAVIPGLPVDSALSSIYGGGSGYAIPASVTLHSTGAYLSSMWGRGCINNTASGVTQLEASSTAIARECAYNGPRWFIGANETLANPISNNMDIYDTGLYPTTLNNAGALAGVDNIWRPIEYFNTPTTTRILDGSFAPFISNSDYTLYWGTAGHIDSVIDLTHNVPVPFNTGIESSFGVLNASAVSQVGLGSPRADGALTFTSITCVAPLHQLLSGLPAGLGCTAANPGALLSQTAILAPSVICLTGGGAASSPPTLACNSQPVGGMTAGTVVNSEGGFLLYLKGRIYMMQMAALPASGTQWTVRDYTGGISGGNGVSGQWGNYIYLPATTRQFTAVGVTYTFSTNTQNVASVATAANLASVHTVPDPYYVTSAYDIAVNAKDIQFVNVPTGATIRIYSSSGVLLRVLQNTTTQFAGIVHWDVRNRTNQFVSSGVYFYTVTAGTLTRTGRMTIVQYASTVQ